MAADLPRRAGMGVRSADGIPPLARL